MTGDMVRIQPDHICFRSLQAIEDVYGQHTKTLKTELYTNVLTETGFRPSVATETHET